MLELLMLINAERVKPLTYDPVLTERAELRADYLCETGQWSHKGWKDSFTGLDRVVIGENLARNFKTDKAAHKALMGSPTHKANIVKAKYTHVGIGKEKCGGKNITVELFSE